MPSAEDSDVAISADGRFVVYVASGQVWRHDLADESVEIVSRAYGCAADPCPGGNGASWDPAVSADGRFVAFATAASDLLAPGVDSNGAYDVYRTDMATGVVEAVSVGAGHNLDPVISDDGNIVAFVAGQSVLGGGPDTNGERDVYRRQMSPYAVTRVGLNADGSESSTGSVDPLMSADGHAVISRIPGPAGPDDTFVEWDQGLLAEIELPSPSPFCGFWAGGPVFRLTDGDHGLDRLAFETECAGRGLSLFVHQVLDRTSASVVYEPPDCGDGVSSLGLLLDDAGSGGVHASTCGDGPLRLEGFDVVGSVETPIEGFGGVGVELHRYPTPLALSDDGRTVAWVEEDDRLRVGAARDAVVASIVPDAPLVPGATVSVTVVGSAFGGDMQLSTTDGITIAVDSVVDDGELLATVAVPAAATPGTYDVVVDRTYPDLGDLRTLTACEGCLVVG